MGQALQTLTSGSDGNKVKDIGPIVEGYYDVYVNSESKELNPADFYQAVCQIIEEINKKLGSTQFRVPTTETLKQAFDRHHKGKGKSLTKEEFANILQEVIIDTGFTSYGAKDIILYIFGVPVITFFIKQRVAPKSIPNDIFIPAVTSVTVYILAKLNKI